MRFFYITALILGTILFAPNLAFADTPSLPSECTGTDYNFIDVTLDGGGGTNGNDFIFIGDNNTTAINGGNGDDCILVGDHNEASISGINGNDVIIVGNHNSGQISGDGENGDDIIVLGDNNIGDVFGGNGADIITIGKNNQGDIFGENGDDDITVGCGNIGAVDGPFKKVPCLPVADPLSGIYTSVKQISLSSEDSDAIYYTLDNSTPSCSPVSGVEYTSPISIIATRTIIVVGCSDTGPASAVATFTYTIDEIEADTEDLTSLADLFTPVASSSAVTVAQNLKINVSTDSGNSQVVLEIDTEITRSDEQTLNVADLTSSQQDINTLSGLATGKVFEAALQWGISGATLEFSKPITIKIFVGSEFNSQTLDVVRSLNGINGWTDVGIVPPATCVVANGICSFQATKASYYAALSNTPVSAPAPAAAVGLQFINSGAGTLPAATPLPEIISTLTPVPAPEVTVEASPIIEASAPKKYARVAVVKEQPVSEPTPAPQREEQAIEPAKSNLLSDFLSAVNSGFRNMVSSVKGLFRKI